MCASQGGLREMLLYPHALGEDVLLTLPATTVP